MKAADLQFPIILTSPMQGGFQFFRRIQRDGFIEAKQLGMEWEPSLNIEEKPYIRPLKKGADVADAIADYVTTLTERLKWKLSKDTGPARIRCGACGCRFNETRDTAMNGNHCDDCRNTLPGEGEAMAANARTQQHLSDFLTQD